MERQFLVCTLSLLLSGCTSRYFVQEDQLRRARAGAAPTVAARNVDGESVWLHSDAVQDGRPVVPSWAEVDVPDRGKTFRITGWIFAGAGLLYGTVGTARLAADDADLDDLILVYLGGLSAATGAGLLLAGYLIGPPEVPPPVGGTADPALLRW
ncbi:hypothetical protein [Vulgatibacter sp.]|uniref:hypothetical protein n=1 Tax=Vulgatibacter sp. TaxID=1971226 RepID=UPI00356806D3